MDDNDYKYKLNTINKHLNPITVIIFSYYKIIVHKS